MLTVERPSRFRENLKRSIARKFLALESFVFVNQNGLVCRKPLFCPISKPKRDRGPTQGHQNLLKVQIPFLAGFKVRALTRGLSAFGMAEKKCVRFFCMRRIRIEKE